MKRAVLLDSSYLIDLERETVADSLGPARRFLPSTAQSLDADLVGADRAAFERLGGRYLRFR